MPLQSSGTITLAQIQAEFGGSNPISLNEYYRGGVYVANTLINAAIPTSGTISFSNFYGASAGISTTFETSRATGTTKSTATAFNTTTTFNTTFDTTRSTSRATNTSRTTSYATTTTYNTIYSAAGSSTIFSVDTGVTSTTSSITIPATAQTGQVAVLFDFGYNSNTTSITNVLPSGWTNIANTANNSAGTGRAAWNCSYKILTSSDPGSSVTGIASALQLDKVLIILTADAGKRITSVSVNSSGSTPIDTTPANTSITVDGDQSIVFGFYGGSALPGTRNFLGIVGQIDVTQSEYLGSRTAVKYQEMPFLFNQGFTSVRIGQNDAGNKNLVRGVEVILTGVEQDVTQSTTRSTDTSRTTTFSTTTAFNTAYATTGSTSRATNTSKTTTTSYDTSTSFETSKSTG